MKTKTYFASSIQAAIDVARRELGPDAMLVNSRPTPDTARSFGRMEVTFAWESGGAADTGNVVFSQTGLRHAASTPRHAGPYPESALEGVRPEQPAVRAAIGDTGNLPACAAQDMGARENGESAVRSLCQSGFEHDVARQIVSAASRSGGRAGDAVLRELALRIPAASFKPLQPGESRILAFAGPPGRGKTASLVKIAVRHGLANGVPARIYTAGAHGVGAAAQTARYAAILGVPFQAMESFECLNLALKGERWKGLVLIDTPGLVLGDQRGMDEMTRFFAAHSDIEKHLVIRAEARSADMQYMLSRFAAIQPSRLLFTGVDEVRGLGAAADTMIRSGIAGQFFGTGPRIPEDLDEVSVPKLARSLWAANGLAATAA